MDMRLSKLREMVKDREAWHAAVMGSQRVGYDLAAEQQGTSLMVPVIRTWCSHCLGPGF